MNFEVINILILFFPGLITMLLIDKLTIHKKITSFFYVIYSFMCGFVSYLIFWIILKLIAKLIKLSPFSEKVNECILNLSNNNLLILKSMNEFVLYILIGASFLSIIIGLISSYFINEKYLFKFCKFIGITNKYGDPDVFSLIVNSKIYDIQWMIIRDLILGVSYVGYYIAHSDIIDDNQFREIFLSDVSVYDDESEKDEDRKIYEVEGMYIVIDKSGRYTIEFLDFLEENKIKLEEKNGEED